MMNSPKYTEGDVVTAKIFFDDGVNFKARPTVIIANISTTPIIQYQVCRITGTNNSERYKGIWVKCETIKGRQIGLSKDSFIDTEKTIVIAEANIGLRKQPPNRRTNNTRRMLPFFLSTTIVTTPHKAYKIKTTMSKYKHIMDFAKPKSEVFNLMDHLDTVHNTFEEGGWSVVRVHDKFIVHETPLYGGQEQFVGIFDETEIEKLIDVLESLT